MRLPPVSFARVLGLIIRLREWPNMKPEEDMWGAYDKDYKRIDYDPDQHLGNTLVHELAHAYRHNLGFVPDDETEEDNTEDERVTMLTEQAICSFVVDNPALAGWLVKKLIVDVLGPEVWEEVLKVLETDPPEGRAS